MRDNALRLRLIFWHVGVALAIFAITAFLVARVTMGGMAARENLIVQNARDEIVHLVDAQQAAGKTLPEIAPAITQRLAHSDLFVVVFDAAGKVLAGTPAPLRSPPPHFAAPLMLVSPSLPAQLKVRGGTILVGTQSRAMAAAAEKLGMVIGLLGIVALLGGVLVGVLVANQSLKPLLETTASLERFALGDFVSHRVKQTDRSEFSRLSRAYNAAVEQINRAFAERDQRERQMRQFVADAGHQLRTPLTVVMGYLTVLSTGDENASQARSFYAVMLEESRRMRGLIDRLILLARLEHGTNIPAERFDLAEVVKDAMASLNGMAASRFRLTVSDRPLVRGDSSEVREAILNVLENALKYGGVGEVEVSIKVAEGRARLEVRDHGAGIPSTDLPLIFDRFYRGGNALGSPGSGLGLTIAQRAVERAQGTMNVKTALGEGTTLTIMFPVSLIQAKGFGPAESLVSLRPTPMRTNPDHHLEEAR